MCQGFRVTDPDRLFAAARSAYQEMNPGTSDHDAAEATAGLSDAIYGRLEDESMLH